MSKYGWVGTKVREVSTQKQGVFSAEKESGRGITLTVAWEDGTSRTVEKWAWAHRSDYEVYLDAGSRPAWVNLGG